MNNAGDSPKGPGRQPVWGRSDRVDDWKWVFQVNFFSSIMLARGLIEELQADPGAVVNVTSIAGSRVHPFAGAAYATSKAALMALTREMAQISARSASGSTRSARARSTPRSCRRDGEDRRGADPAAAAGHAGRGGEDDLLPLLGCIEFYVNGAEIHVNGGQHV